MIKNLLSLSHEPCRRLHLPTLCLCPSPLTSPFAAQMGEDGPEEANSSESSAVASSPWEDDSPLAEEVLRGHTGAVSLCNPLGACFADARQCHLSPI